MFWEIVSLKKSELHKAPIHKMFMTALFIVGRKINKFKQKGITSVNSVMLI